MSGVHDFGLTLAVSMVAAKTNAARVSASEEFGVNEGVELFRDEIRSLGESGLDVGKDSDGSYRRRGRHGVSRSRNRASAPPPPALSVGGGWWVCPPLGTVSAHLGDY